MNSKNYQEDRKVKIPAAIHFLRLGYDYQSNHESQKNNSFNYDVNICKKRFEILKNINHKDFTTEEINSIISEISETINKNDNGKQFFDWLINPKHRVKLVDFDYIYNNNFAIIPELPFYNQDNSKSFRPDITILINGMPLSFLEVKKPNNYGGIREEFKRIKGRISEKDYQKFFNMIQIISFSNNMENELNTPITQVTAGSFYTTPNKNQSKFHTINNNSAIDKKIS